MRKQATKTQCILVDIYLEAKFNKDSSVTIPARLLEELCHANNLNVPRPSKGKV